MQNKPKKLRKPAGTRKVVSRIRTQAKYNPSYCNDLIDMAHAGYSVLGFCGAIGICERTFYYWIGIYPEFSESHEVAKAIRVYDAETKFLTAKDALSVTKANTLMRAYGPKVWNPKEQIPTRSIMDMIDLSSLSDNALEEFRKAVGIKLGMAV